jgi:dihydrofolate reductase
MVASIDAIFLGRTTYEGFAAPWLNSTQPEAAKMNSLAKFVVSTTLREATWSNATILANDVVNAIARMKPEPRKDLAIIGRSVLTASLALLGLIDECRFFVAPVLSRSGERALDDLPGRLDLTLNETHVYQSGVVPHSYSIADARS